VTTNSSLTVPRTPNVSQASPHTAAAVLPSPNKDFKFDDRKEPAIQVAELNTRLNCLATHGFNLDYRIQAMIILSGLPQSWDSVQGSILANHDMADLSISVIMPILQEEWQR
jgi:hypothetical protein